ncbi:AroM family protein [Sporosarcina sp. Te-1]|uniref:AroM family protein n=1 Tax=Sporosarcina sp. Te-1 TaxID=2818390 RepID=UPI001A9D5FB8|nr:AroM family protein [Sporosarcina sp. Te-1]QTD41527.1 AroM family protein [Sporosarcina sp. Te-1]
MFTLLTIGQTPREDLMKAFIKGGVQDVQLIGALDGVSESEIKRLEKVPGEEKLYVVHNKGTSNISHECIEEKIEKLIRQYENSSDAIALLCMSEFKSTSDQTTIIYPIKELREKASNINSNDKTIIFIPIKEQLTSAKLKWANVKGDKQFVVANPKVENVLGIVNKEITLHSPSYVILDCYGYDYELVDEIERNHECTCYNAQNLVVKKLKSL